MKQFSIYSIIRVIGILLVFAVFLNCKKEIIASRPPQEIEGSMLAAEGGSLVASGVQSQTRTANLFNNYGEAVLDLWARKGIVYVADNDNSYAYSKKLTPGNSTLQLQLHDFRFDIPAGSTIMNITVSARRFETGKGSISDYFAHLIKKGEVIQFNSYGVRFNDPRIYPDAETEVTYSQSGTGDNGGLGNQFYQWTPEMINNLAFGVRINTYSPVGGTVVVYYDQVTITIQYSLP